MSQNQLKYGALINYGTILIYILGGLIVTPWMIGKVGQANYGLFTLVYSIIVLLKFDFGLNSAVSKFISNFLAKKEYGSIKDFLGLVYKIYFAIDILILIVGLVIFFNINIIYSKLTPNELVIFKNMYIVVLIFTLVSFPLSNLGGILVAYEQFVPLKLCDLLDRTLCIVLMVLFLLMGFGVYSLIMVNVCVGILVVIIKLYLVNKKTSAKVNIKYFDKDFLKNIFSFTIWTTIISVCDKIISSLVPNILAMFSGAVGVSIFALANTLNRFVFMFAVAINGLFMPMVARLNVLPNRLEELNKLSIKVGRLILILVSFIVVLFISFGKSFLIYIWHRPEFIDSYLCAVIIMIPDIFVYTLLISETMLMVDEKVHYNAYIYAGYTILNIILACVLSKYFNYLGASISIFISLMVRWICLVCVSAKILHLDMKKYCMDVYVKLLPYFIVLLIFGLGLEKYNPILNQYVRFISNLIVYICLFGFIIIKFAFNEYEKNLIIGPIKKILKK